MQLMDNRKILGVRTTNIPGGWDAGAASDSTVSHRHGGRSVSNLPESKPQILKSLGYSA